MNLLCLWSSDFQWRREEQTTPPSRKERQSCFSASAVEHQQLIKYSRVLCSVCSALLPRKIHSFACNVWLMLKPWFEAVKSNASLSSSRYPCLRCHFGVAKVSSSVPKYRSPNSPMPGMTRKSASRDESISEVTILSFGNFWHTAWIPWGDCIQLSKYRKIWYESRHDSLDSNGWNASFWARLTAIRLRKMIFDSGTPLLRRREIAFTAEFPVNVQEHLFLNNQVLVVRASKFKFFHGFIVPNLKREQGRARTHGGWRYPKAASRILTARILWDLIHMEETESSQNGIVSITDLPPIVSFSMDEDLPNLDAFTARPQCILHALAADVYDRRLSHK